MQAPTYDNYKLMATHQQTFFAAELPLIAVLMDESNIPPSQWLLGTGLNSLDLDNGVDKFTLDTRNIIYRNIFRLSKRGDISIQLGLCLNISRWGVFGLPMMCASSLREALLTAKKNLSIVDPYFKLEGEIIDNSLNMRFINQSKFSFPATEELTHEFVFSALARQISDILGEPFKFNKLQLPYDRPKYHRAYNKFIAHEVEFNSLTCGAWLPKKLLDGRLIFSNKVAYQQAIEICNKEVTRLENQRKGSIHLIVKHELDSDPYSFPKLDALADQLSLSPRTLRRRLKDAGTSYREIIQNHQQNIALRELAEKKCSITKIAEHCGFTDTTGFREAFKRWTNISLAEYQKRLL